MVHVGEGIHARERVVGHLADDAVDHAGGAGRGRDLPGVQHAQAQGVVGLVAGPVGDRGSFLQAQLLCGSTGQEALLAEGRPNLWQDCLVETEAGQQTGGRFVFDKIPEDAFRQTADGRADGPRHPGGDIVARKHHLPDAFVKRRFILLHPRELGGGEVARRIEQVLQTPVFPQPFISLLAVRNGARVTPDDGGAQHVQVLVDADQPVHLVGDADGLDIFFVDGIRLPKDVPRRFLEIGKPLRGILLGPAGLLGADGRLGLRIEGGGNATSASGLHQRGLYGRTADIVTE